MWEANRSVKIRGHLFYDHDSPDEKGTAIDFLGAFYNMRFQDAVLTLIGDDYRGAPLLRSEKVLKEKKPFVLPKRNRKMTRVYAYLMQERRIDESIISLLTSEPFTRATELTIACSWDWMSTVRPGQLTSAVLFLTDLSGAMSMDQKRSISSTTLVVVIGCMCLRLRLT